jgi:hypothetical protein
MKFYHETNSNEHQPPSRQDYSHAQSEPFKSDLGDKLRIWIDLVPCHTLTFCCLPVTASTEQIGIKTQAQEHIKRYMYRIQHFHGNGEKKGVAKSAKGQHRSIFISLP